MKLRTKRVRTIIVFAGTLILGVAALAIAWRLQQEKQITEEEASAASEEVTNADVLETAAERADFHTKWQTFMLDETKTWEDYVEYAMGEGARYKCDQVIMESVGEETLYGCDLNALFIIYDADVYTSAEEITPQNTVLNEVLDLLITDSGLLQEASKQGLITLDSTYYNSPTKDMVERFAQTATAREQIGDTFVKRIDFEVLSIYFFNEQEPEIGEAAAKEAALAKMQVLYDRLNSGEITMEEAGDEIIADEIKGDTTGVSLSALDRLYKENAYMKVEGYEFDGRIFTDVVYDEELKSLGEGQMSTIRTAKDFQFTAEEFEEAGGDKSGFPFEDSCYLIFKLNDIDFGVSEEESSDSLADVEDRILQEYK